MTLIYTEPVTMKVSNTEIIEMWEKERYNLLRVRLSGRYLLLGYEITEGICRLSSGIRRPISGVVVAAVELVSQLAGPGARGSPACCTHECVRHRCKRKRDYRRHQMMRRISSINDCEDLRRYADAQDERREDRVAFAVSECIVHVGCEEREPEARKRSEARHTSQC